MHMHILCHGMPHLYGELVPDNRSANKWADAGHCFCFESPGIAACSRELHCTQRSQCFCSEVVQHQIQSAEPYKCTVAGYMRCKRLRLVFFQGTLSMEVSSSTCSGILGLLYDATHSK